ncbi:ThiF family adenylyltransferase [Microbacterium sp.]|uniref:ThiF family adenylyltransferase n=1 Tax=Microbacterium sp. TaxID=51671 RepID=UPI0039E597F6
MPLPPLVEPVAALTDAERERTARHAALAGFGELAQRRLAAAHVAVVGAGGLGSAVVLALAAAGIGTLTVIDDDDVDASNLQRQVMHRRSDIGSPKTDSAARVAADLSDTVVVPVARRLTRENAAELLSGADVVIDGSDLFATRAAVAAGAEALGIPLVWGTVQEFDAQVTVFWNRPPEGVAPVVLADLYPADTVGALPTCAEVGVLGALCVQVGGMLALEAIKLVAGVGEPLLGRIMLVNALRGRQTEVTLRSAARMRHPVGMTDDLPHDAAPAAPAQLTAAEMLAAQDAGATLLDVREPWETDRGIVADSLLIPLGTLLADPGQVDAERVVVICEHGLRAARAAEALAACGVAADVLAGGLAAWRNGA